MIYFIQANPSGHIKIGYTGNDPARRLASLQTGCPEPLSLIGSIDGGIEAEKALHARFAAHRLRPDGEWFSPADELVDEIGELLRPKPRFPVLFGKEIKSVYLAGKITRTTWRDEIAPGWSEYDAHTSSWHHCDISCPVPDRADVELTGPFWSDPWSGHGSIHSAAFPHASGVDMERDEFGRDFVPDLQIKECKEIANAIGHAIQRSDLVFAWVDSLDCYGTLFEIGYAKSLDKIVVIYRQNDFDASQLWLTLVNARHFDKAGNPAAAWDDLFTPNWDESLNAGTGV